MSKIGDQIIQILSQNPGLSDREITDAIHGHQAPQQYVNRTCRSLESQGVISRSRRADGILGNYLTGKNPFPEPSSKAKSGQDYGSLPEKKIKQVLETYLSTRGWNPKIAWGQSHGPDIEAKRGTEQWVIEVKGSGSLDPMRVNYFLSVLGEILQRMYEPKCKYSIALPDMKQFRGLWERLPILAKNRTGITALFINSAGNVIEELNSHI